MEMTLKNLNKMSIAAINNEISDATVSKAYFHLDADLVGSHKYRQLYSKLEGQMIVRGLIN